MVCLYTVLSYTTLRDTTNHNADHLSASSLNTILDRIQVAYKWGVKQGIISTNPADMIESIIEREDVPCYLEEEEIERLWAAAANDRDFAILALLLDSGMRVGEIAGMRKEDLGKAGVQVSGKSGGRTVPVSPGVAELLVAQGDDRGMWIGHQGKLSKSGLQQIVRRTMKRAGLDYKEKIGPHTLRHTFGVQYNMNEGDIPTLKRIMGHKKVDTTMRYLNVSNKLVIAQHRKASPMSVLLAKQEAGRRCSDGKLNRRHSTKYRRRKVTVLPHSQSEEATFVPGGVYLGSTDDIASTKRVRDYT